ncbi:hypothetical protein AAMO2058_001722600, partial [Amorphochlora amoebiformis]
GITEEEKEHMYALERLKIAEKEAEREFKRLNAKLITEAIRGNTEGCKALLEEKANVITAGEDGITPLIAAVQAKQKASITFLVENKADVEQLDDEGRSALDVAISIANAGVVKLLVSARANVNEPDAASDYPIFKCATRQTGKLLSLLLESKADTSVTREEDDSTALMMAAFSGSEECAKLLIKHRANLDQKNRNGNTALMVACYAGNTNVTLTLTLNLTDRNTALHLATLGGVMELVIPLCQAGADTNQVDKLGDTPLILASEMGNQELMVTLIGFSAKCVDHLIECKADVKHMNHDGISPMTVLADEMNTEGVTYLMEHVLESMDWGLMSEARDIIKGGGELETAVLKGCENYADALHTEISESWSKLEEVTLRTIVCYLDPTPCLVEDNLSQWISPPVDHKASVTFQDQLKFGAHRLRKAKKRAQHKKEVKKDDLFSGLRQMLANRKDDLHGRESDDDIGDDDSDFE